MHRLIVRQVKGAERFVVSHADGRSAEDEATVASSRSRMSSRLETRAGVVSFGTVVSLGGNRA